MCLLIFIHACLAGDTYRHAPIKLQRAAAAEAARVEALRALEKAGKASNRMRSEDSPEPLRFDADLGMNIYSASALKIGQGKGDSALCPFDCECCY